MSFSDYDFGGNEDNLEITDESILGATPRLDMDQYDSKPNVKSPYSTRTVVNGKVIYKCFVVGPIGDEKAYDDIIEILTVADPDEIVEIHVSSPGGRIDVCARILLSMDRCKAKVITVADGLCASCGSLIWSNGEETRISPFSFFMYHMSLHFDMGNSTLIRKKAEVLEKFINRTLKECAVSKGHLLEDELKRLNDNQCIWISADEMKKRIGVNNG